MKNGRAQRRKSRVNSSVDFDGKRVLQKKKKSNGIFEELSASTWKDDNCRTLSKPINEFARAETIRFPDNARQKRTYIIYALGWKVLRRFQLSPQLEKRYPKIWVFLSKHILPGWNLYYLSSPTKKWCEEITDREWKTLRDVFDSSNKILNYTPNIKRASQSAHFYNQCKKSNLAGKVNP